MDFTVFDYIIFSILGFFTLIGLVRGFIIELFSFLTWVGSILLTALLRPVILNIVLQKTSNIMLANIITVGILFVIIIVGFSVLTSNISRKITTKFPISINITLGIAFGFLKGFVISTLIFITIIDVFTDNFTFDKEVGPKWLRNSASYTPLSFGASFVLPSISPFFDNMKQNLNKTKKEEKNNDSLQRFILEKTEDKKDDQDKEEKKDQGGYNKNQVEKLEHLIDLI